tara:strand:+ start:453 stop:635 length:183 start_codon:yes stop_codon:yes gene_type:complete
MSPFNIALTVNVILTIAIISLIFKTKLIDWYSKKESNRERRKVARVRKIVLEYLNELKND